MTTEEAGRTYSQLAREMNPGYAVPGAPCDVPDCKGKTSGSRTISFVREAGPVPDVSILIRLCPPHMQVSTAELRTLLPALGSIADAAGEPLLGWQQSLAPDSAPGPASEQAGRGPEAPSTRSAARQVLDYHVDLHDRLAHPTEAHKLFMAAVAQITLQEADESPVQFGEQPIPGNWRVQMMFYPYGADMAGNPAVAGQFLTDLARDLFDARTYQVTPEMCDLGVAMMGQVAGKDTPLDEEEMPAPWGFCWLDRPYVHPDRNGREISTRAFSWGTCNLPPDLMSVGHDGNTTMVKTSGRGVRVAFWHLAGDPDGYENVSPGVAGEIAQEQGPLAWFHTETMPFGFPMSNTIAEELHTWWSLMNMEITSTIAEDPGRGARRRAQRSIRHDQVNVVTLRRPAHESTGSAPRLVDWKCCWLVRGHRRLAPHGGTFKDGRASTWIKPYIKGPDDKPLRATDILYRLSK